MKEGRVRPAFFFFQILCGEHRFAVQGLELWSTAISDAKPGPAFAEIAQGKGDVMTRKAETGVFRPVGLKAETRDEITARVARDIMKTEMAERVAKTERLRAARLALEASEPVAVKAVASRRSR